MKFILTTITLKLGNVFRLSWRIAIVIVILWATQVRSEYISSQPIEKVRTFTRWDEFDYVTWTIEALWQKQLQASLGVQSRLDALQQRQVVFDYIRLVGTLEQAQGQIAEIFADPAAANPENTAAELLNLQRDLEDQIQLRGGLAEAVIQAQISEVVGRMGLGMAGQPVPPVLYHVTPLPMALIVSPREVIRQDVDISLQPDLSLDHIVSLEAQVETELDVSALVVPIGGVGVYPTMVKSTTNLAWMIETAAHEWVHNYLTLHPLGALYFSTPELRTINETTASIAGKEIGQAVLARYYPEFMPQLSAKDFFTFLGPELPVSEGGEETFDFLEEMHETRVTTDALLAEGKLEEAEAYMEQRREVFWANGYRIRRINQAYFAFTGAYAESPRGAAGDDPVGAAVRDFRAGSLNLEAFLERIAWVTSYDALQRLVTP